MRAGAGINIREQIFVAGAFVMIETQIHAATMRAHIPCVAMIHRDVMNKLATKIEISKEIILPLKIESVVPRAARRVGLARGFKHDSLKRAILRVG